MRTEVRESMTDLVRSGVPASPRARHLTRPAPAYAVERSPPPLHCSHPEGGLRRTQIKSVKSKKMMVTTGSLTTNHHHHPVAKNG